MWCAPYFASNLAEHIALLGARSPLYCPQGTLKEIKIELGFLRPDEILAMATCARLGSAPSITFILTDSEESKDGCNRLVGMALRPGCANLIAWRGTFGQVRQGSPLEQNLVSGSILCPLTEIAKHLARIPEMARASWTSIMLAYKHEDAASRADELIICGASLVEFVAGTHFGRSGGQKLSEEDRNISPALFKLLKLTGSVATYDFGPLLWHPDERSSALEAILDRMALAPGGAGAQRMLESETGHLQDLYIPCFNILKSLDTNSPLVDHLASPAPAKQSSPLAAIPEGSASS